MGKVFLRSAFISFLVSGMLTVSLFGLGGYILLEVGRSGVQETRRLTQDRGLEIVAALAQLAAEETSRFNESAKVSMVMHEIVDASARSDTAQNSGFFVTKVFWVNTSGEVIAHSDLAMVARDADLKADESYNQAFDNMMAMTRSHSNFVDVKVLSSQQSAAIPLLTELGEIAPDLAAAIQETYPERITTELLIGHPVFPVDSDVPGDGAIFLVAKTESLNAYVHRLRGVTVDALIMSAVFIFIVSFGVFFLIMIAFMGAYRVPAAPAQQAAPSRTPEPSASRSEEKVAAAQPAQQEAPAPEPLPANREVDGPRSAKVEGPAQQRPALRVMDAIPLENVSSRMARRN